MFSLSTKKVIMKSLLNLLFIITGSLIFGLSCTKNNDVPASILGKWNIEIDSSYVGVGAGNHKVSYAGRSGDYFNFSPDGHIYIMENSILDTLIYTSVSDSIFVQNFGSGEGKCQFQSPSTKNLVITSEYSYTPGGTFGRTVYLTR